jgi:peptidoglycan hydrolase CwlO-like protein
LLGITVPPPVDCCNEVFAILDTVQKDLVGLSDRITKTESGLTVVENRQNVMSGKLDATQRDVEILAGNLAETVGRLDSVDTDIAKINALIERVRSDFCPPA